MRRLLWILSLIMAFSAAVPIMAADLILPSNPNGNYYNANGNILSQGTCTVQSGANVKCSTFDEITLNPGFETIQGSSFYADINNQDDTGGNGLPDWWEIFFFGHSGVDPGADPDGDGLTNLQEYQGRTNPTVFNSVPPTANLAADPTTVIIGGQTTLSWTTTGATLRTITPGIGNVAASGSIPVTPADTTTYTLTATGPGGTTTAPPVTVTVQFVEPVVDLTAQPSTIALGQATTLTWTSQYGYTITIMPGIGSVPPNGSVLVSPGQTGDTIFTITATNKLYSAFKSVPVTVTIDPSVKPGTYYEYDSMGRIKRVIKVIPQ